MVRGQRRRDAAAHEGKPAAQRASTSALRSAVAAAVAAAGRFV